MVGCVGTGDEGFGLGHFQRGMKEVRTTSIYSVEEEDRMRVSDHFPLLLPRKHKQEKSTDFHKPP